MDDCGGEGRRKRRDEVVGRGRVIKNEEKKIKLKERKEEGEGDCGVFFGEYFCDFYLPVFISSRGGKKRNKIDQSKNSRNDSSI